MISGTLFSLLDQIYNLFNGRREKSETSCILMEKYLSDFLLQECFICISSLKNQIEMDRNIKKFVDVLSQDAISDSANSFLRVDIEVRS